MLPELEYYDLTQLAQRWKVCHSHICHYVETGKLASACWLAKSAVEYGKWKLNAQGFELFEPFRLDIYNGFVGVNHEDARLAFRKGSVVQPHFYSLQDKEFVLRLVKEGDFTLTQQDICVMKQEVKHFESCYIHEPKAISLTFSDNFQTLKFDEKTYRLGQIQAKILQQLQEASQTTDQWVHGKTLLHRAGS